MNKYRVLFLTSEKYNKCPLHKYLEAQNDIILTMTTTAPNVQNFTKKFWYD